MRIDEITNTKYTPHYLPSRGRRGGSQRIGVIHAVEPEENGVNFNRSLCGKTPGARSLGWDEDTTKEVNCPKCLKKLAELGNV